MARTTGRYDVILQGSGRLVLVFKGGDADKAVIGQFMDAARRHLEEGLPIAVLSGVRDIIDNRPLNERMLTPILTRDRSDGRYHTRYIAVHEQGHERLLADPKCKVDPEKFDVVESLPESLDRNVLCYECFPPVEREVTATAGAI